MTDKIDWEVVVQDDYTQTTKLKVDGGHLYHRLDVFEQGGEVAMCFVPEVDLQRYQAHLRDAYTQGFKDGQQDGMNLVTNIAKTIGV